MGGVVFRGKGLFIAIARPPAVDGIGPDIISRVRRQPDYRTRKSPRAGPIRRVAATRGRIRRFAPAHAPGRFRRTPVGCDIPSTRCAVRRYRRWRGCRDQWDLGGVDWRGEGFIIPIARSHDVNSVGPDMVNHARGQPGHRTYRIGLNVVS